MAILEEPAAKRRRLNVSEVEHHVDLNALTLDLMAVSPWEIITAGIPLYQRLHVATANTFLPSPPTQTTQRLYNMLLQHLEICLQWTATDTDECDDQELYVHAVTGIVQCLQHIYTPELDDKSDDDDDDVSSSPVSMLFRTLGFLLQHADSSSSPVEGILQIVRFRITATGAVWDALSTIQQLDGIMLLVQVSSKTALSILTLLQHKNAFAKIALEVMLPSNASMHPRTRTETLFAWQCHMVHAGTRSESLPDNIVVVNTLRSVVLETQQKYDHCSLLDRTLALDCLVSLSQYQLSDDDESRCCLRHLVLYLLSNQQQRLNTASCSVTALQNLLVGQDDDDETLFEYFDALDDPPTFLTVLLQVSQSCRDQNHLVEERFLQTANHFHNVSVWALELFWTFVSVAIRRLDDDDISTEAVVELALSSIDDCCRGDEYKLYLAARTICRDHPFVFQTQSKSSSLVTALCIILHDSNSSAVSKVAVISFFQNIVQESDDVSLLISQDRDVLDVIAQLGAMGENDEASMLLFALSDYVPNRMRLVRRPRVLLAMMRFAQQQLQPDDKGRYYQRRIGQLAELL